MALTVTGPIAITYAGGASGPASTTAAALAAGFAIPVLPSGGSATFAAPVNITGVVQQSNTATVATPPGINDPTPANNTSTAVTNPVVPPCCLAFGGLIVTPNTVPSGTSFTVKANVSETCGAPSVGGVAEITGLPAAITGTQTQAYPALAANGTYQMTWTFTNTSGAALTVNANVHSNVPVGTCPPDLPFSFNTAAALPLRSLNITTFKNNMTPAAPASGTLATFRNAFVNTGPDAADGVAIRDVPGAGYGSRWVINPGLPIDITYTGGASGPASATLPQLIAPGGIVIPTWPAGDTVVVEYSVNMIASGNGNRNTADLVFPPDVIDTFPGDDFRHLDFNISGTAQTCACNSSVTINQGDIFFGGQFTGSVNTPGGICCAGGAQLRVRYWFPAANPALLSAVAGSIDSTVPCGVITPYLDPSPAQGWYRYSVVVTDSLGGVCEVAEGGYVVNSSLLPNQGQQAINSGTWPAHHVI